MVQLKLDNQIKQNLVVLSGVAILAIMMRRTRQRRPTKMNEFDKTNFIRLELLYFDDYVTLGNEFSQKVARAATAEQIVDTQDEQPEEVASAESSTAVVGNLFALFSSQELRRMQRQWAHQELKDYCKDNMIFFQPDVQAVGTKFLRTPTRKQSSQILYEGRPRRRGSVIALLYESPDIASIKLSQMSPEDTMVEPPSPGLPLPYESGKQGESQNVSVEGHITNSSANRTNELGQTPRQQQNSKKFSLSLRKNSVHLKMSSQMLSNRVSQTILNRPTALSYKQSTLVLSRVHEPFSACIPHVKTKLSEPINIASLKKQSDVDAGDDEQDEEDGTKFLGDTMLKELPTTQKKRRTFASVMRASLCGQVSSFSSQDLYGLSHLSKIPDQFCTVSSRNPLDFKRTIYTEQSQIHLSKANIKDHISIKPTETKPIGSAPHKKEKKLGHTPSPMHGISPAPETNEIDSLISDSGDSEDCPQQQVVKFFSMENSGRKNIAQQKMRTWKNKILAAVANPKIPETPPENKQKLNKINSVRSYSYIQQSQQIRESTSRSGSRVASANRTYSFDTVEPLPRIMIKGVSQDSAFVKMRTQNKLINASNISVAQQNEPSLKTSQMMTSQLNQGEESKDLLTVSGFDRRTSSNKRGSRGHILESPRESLHRSLNFGKLKIDVLREKLQYPSWEPGGFTEEELEADNRYKQWRQLRGLSKRIKNFFSEQVCQTSQAAEAFRITTKFEKEMSYSSTSSSDDSSLDDRASESESEVPSPKHRKEPQKIQTPNRVISDATLEEIYDDDSSSHESSAEQRKSASVSTSHENTLVSVLVSACSDCPTNNKALSQIPYIGKHNSQDAPTDCIKPVLRLSNGSKLADQQQSHDFNSQYTLGAESSRQKNSTSKSLQKDQSCSVGDIESPLPCRLTQRLSVNDISSPDLAAFPQFARDSSGQLQLNLKEAELDASDQSIEQSREEIKTAQEGCAQPNYFLAQKFTINLQPINEDEQEQEDKQVEAKGDLTPGFCKKPPPQITFQCLMQPLMEPVEENHSELDASGPLELLNQEISTQQRRTFDDDVSHGLTIVQEEASNENTSFLDTSRLAANSDAARRWRVVSQRNQDSHSFQNSINLSQCLPMQANDEEAKSPGLPTTLTNFRDDRDGRYSQADLDKIQKQFLAVEQQRLSDKNAHYKPSSCHQVDKSETLSSHQFQISSQDEFFTPDVLSNQRPKINSKEDFAGDSDVSLRISENTKVVVSSRHVDHKRMVVGKRQNTNHVSAEIKRSRSNSILTLDDPQEIAPSESDSLNSSKFKTSSKLMTLRRSRMSMNSGSSGSSPAKKDPIKPFKIWPKVTQESPRVEPEAQISFDDFKLGGTLKERLLKEEEEAPKPKVCQTTKSVDSPMIRFAPKLNKVRSDAMRRSGANRSEAIKINLSPDVVEEYDRFSSGSDVSGDLDELKKLFSQANKEGKIVQKLAEIKISMKKQNSVPSDSSGANIGLNKLKSLGKNRIQIQQAMSQFSKTMYYRENLSPIVVKKVNVNDQRTRQNYQSPMSSPLHENERSKSRAFRRAQRFSRKQSNLRRAGGISLKSPVGSTDVLVSQASNQQQHSSAANEQRLGEKEQAQLHGLFSFPSP